MKRILLAVLFTAGMILMNISSSYAITGGQLFNKKGCILCHAIDGKGGSMGPNLSAIGKIRSESWIAKQIINPKLNFFTPNSFVIFHGKTYRSFMPADKKISAQNLNKLAGYLASLK